MAAGAIAKPLEGIIESEARNAFEPYIRSFGSMLEKSKVGSYFKELLSNQYEPMSKQAQSAGRQTIEKLFNAVPEHLHKEVTAAVTTGKPSTNLEVNKAAQQLRNIVQSKAHLKVDFQGFGETELLKWLNWNKKVVTTQTRKQIMGEGDEIISSILNAAERERGPHYANAIADGIDVYFHSSGGGYPEKFRLGANKLIEARTEQAGVIRPSSKFENIADWERSMRKVMAYSFTPRIVIPHLSQAINSLLVNGVSATAKATWELASGRAKNWEQQIVDSGAMEDEIFYHLLDKNSWLNKLRQPGFSQVREFQLKLNAIAGKYAATSAVEDFKNGVKNADARLKFFGLDPQVIAKRGYQLNADDEKTAMFRSAKETMFIRSGLDTPFKWDESWQSRLIFMYKHYMFNEGRLIADSFKRSYKEEGIKGLMKTVGIVGSVFPVAGFAISQLENIATGHPVGKLPKSEEMTGNKFIDEYISSIGHVAGFGIGMNMMHAARRRSLAGYMAGPIFSSAFDLLQDIGSGNYREAVKDITRKGWFVGPLVTNKLLPPKSKKKNTGGYY